LNEKLDQMVDAQVAQLGNVFSTGALVKGAK